MTILIDRATEEDVPGIIALLRQPDMAPRDNLSLDAMRELFARLNREGGPEIYVARDGDRVIGTFSLTLIRHFSHNGGHSMIAEDVVVASDQRGRGVGRMMMNAAMQKARGMKCYKLALSSNLARDAAHAFYEKAGFRKHGYSFAVLLDEAPR